VTGPSATRLLISAGEVSGDRLGGALVAAIRARRPDLALEGCGGPLMAGAGLEVRCDVARLSAMGFLEVLGAAPRHLALYRRFAAEARRGRFGGAVLIDYPGFHLRLGAALRRSGVPVVQFVAPQLWAWRPQRLGQLARAADRVAAILPFEEEWFSSRGVPCTFVGHPLVDREWPARPTARSALNLPLNVPVLGIFPGTREGEITLNWPLFRDVARRMLAEGCCRRVVVAGTPGGYYPDPQGFLVHRGDPDLVLAASTAVLIKSGTTVLEAAWTGTPMVVAYRSPRMTYEIARHLMTVEWISLANLVLAAPLVPEFWRLPVRAAEVADALRPLLDESTQEAAAQRAGLKRVRGLLGSRGAAGRVADMVLDLLAC
jgi:lipid-A-disaccharide synthase